MYVIYRTNETNALSDKAQRVGSAAGAKVDSTHSVAVDETDAGGDTEENLGETANVSTRSLNDNDVVFKSIQPHSKTSLLLVSKKPSNASSATSRQHHHHQQQHQHHQNNEPQTSREISSVKSKGTSKRRVELAVAAVASASVAGASDVAAAASAIAERKDKTSAGELSKQNSVLEAKKPHALVMDEFNANKTASRIHYYKHFETRVNLDETAASSSSGGGGQLDDDDLERMHRYRQQNKFTLDFEDEPLE